jgi:beta-lactam-binding protein with PASTA domain
VSVATRALSALRSISIVFAIAIAFLFGLATTVYLSLRSPEVTVPEVVGKDRFEAERVLGDASLNFRVRATRPSNQLKANTVLFQLPRAGEVVKAGQTVAMDISRVAKEGEATEPIAPEKKPGEEKAAEVRNTNESAANTSEDRPKRNKNTNANTNRNTNGAANTNTNRTNESDNANSNRNSNQNENRRPPVPKPSPSAHSTNPENP